MTIKKKNKSQKKIIRQKKIIIKKKKHKDDKLATHSTEETIAFLQKLTGGRLTLGEAIRSIRQCDDIKQSVFAKKLGVSQSYLCDLENDRKEVSPKKAAEFARILEDSEPQFVRLAIQDMLIRQGLHYTIELHKAA